MVPYSAKALQERYIVAKEIHGDDQDDRVHQPLRSAPRRHHPEHLVPANGVAFLVCIAADCSPPYGSVLGLSLMTYLPAYSDCCAPHKSIDYDGQIYSG